MWVPWIRGVIGKFVDPSRRWAAFVLVFGLVWQRRLACFERATKFSEGFALEPLVRFAIVRVFDALVRRNDLGNSFA